MKSLCFFALAIFLVGATPFCCGSGRGPISARQEDDAAHFEQSFARDVRPLLDRYCVECHEGDDAEAETDLGPERSFADLGGQPELWQKVREVLRHDQMPPEDSLQPGDEELARIEKWVHEWLKHAARANAGDPGPVILRRLANAEYNYSIQDLTGVDSLNPTREFPVDSAAGEGFTNTGAAQGMSPALMAKYLDAAHEVAQHVVLLPDGIRFSPFTSRRDQSAELLRQVQEFYRRYTDEGSGMHVDLQGIEFDTNHGGVIPLARYFEATLAHRDELFEGTTSVEKVAEELSLNSKYLSRLWAALTQESADRPAVGLDHLREQWRNATLADVPKLTAFVEQAQKALWQFNPVGQIGRAGGPVSWMDVQSPLVTRQELSIPLGSFGDRDIVIYLAARDLGDGKAHPIVEWQRPRIEFDNGRSPILLRDLAPFCSQIETSIAADLPATARYLAAVRELRAGDASIPVLAEEHGLNAARLRSWAEYTGLGPESPEIRGLLSERLESVSGYQEINGWGSAQTPSIITNRSRDTIAFSTLTLPPQSVFVHPSPTLESVIGWRSPIAGKIRVRGIVADADNNCGNGIEWSVLHHSLDGPNIVAGGVIENTGHETFEAGEEIDVRRGDLVSLIIGPRSNDHTCDTTHVDMTLDETGGERRTWTLSAEVVDRIAEANPLPDSLGNADVWHFCARATGTEPGDLLPANSAIARWRAAVTGARPMAEIRELESSVQHVLTTGEPDLLEKADRELREKLLAWNGPLRWLDEEPVPTSYSPGKYGLDPSLFGTHPAGTSIEATSLCQDTPHVVEVRLPRHLLANATLRATGVLHSASAISGAGEGIAQLTISDSPSADGSIIWTNPILVSDGPGKERLEQDLREFRELFPAALCYGRIVPVDEVVTLTLYHREDKHLQRLMLDDAERAELDRLWDQLLFVSQEPLLLTTAFEQISEFATQDRPDLVTAFAPMRAPIYERAEAFRKRMIAAEAGHVTAVVRFARHAWRRPLTGEEEQKLRNLYGELRAADLPHDEAIRLTLSRVLTSPLFLYKLEQAGGGIEPAPISPHELATRLSYFLWSSLPDGPLAESAASGRLMAGILAGSAHDGAAGNDSELGELLQQTQRMLDDPRIRRLAVQFACQWLHVRDFDQNDDKNEQMFPEFATLRGEMYEETVRFFEDMFRNDGCILDMIDGDHTFLNESLARHYGIDGVHGTEWRKLDGMRRHGRGGILGMATVLASQSGASRTSPILRGVWVSETLLGERLPRPPADVPKLPDALPDGLTARQMIERHSREPQCAKCHSRIDPCGIALEQFDAIGRLYEEPLDTRSRLPDGTTIEGLPGLQNYLSTARRDDFVRQFCRKLLGYALGREVQLSDEPLLDQMQESLKQNGYRFSVAVESIVTSPQFRGIRGQTPGQ